MGKRIILNLSDTKLKGDVLDVGESYGIIYNITKEMDDEIAVDYIEGSEEIDLVKGEYDTCTVFFCLSSVWREGTRNAIIKDVSKLIKIGGEILIWDINKDRGEMFNNSIGAVLPSGKIKEFEFKNINIMSKSNIDDTKLMLEKNYNITEEKLWEDIYFLKGEKK